MNREKRTLPGVLVVVLTIVTLSVSLPGQTYRVIHNFNMAAGDGAGPQAGLTWDAHGNLYGTTFSGGTPGGCQGYTCGTVFELTPAAGGGWNESVIYNFVSPDGRPDTPLSTDSKGNLYGADLGSNNGSKVFKLIRGPSGSWSEQVLHDFDGNGDGQFAEAGLTIGSGNVLYGTTLAGGEWNLGVVFAIPLNTIPQETVIHSFFPGVAAGANPLSTYLQEIDGSLYGTTEAGGLYNQGTVFRLSPSGSGWTASTIYSFKGHSHNDGALPIAGLLPDGAGNFYGVTESGGNGCGSTGCGTVYKLTHNADGSWSDLVLHSFERGLDGNSPWGNLIFDHSGNIYGTTYAGGQQSGYGYGTVFELTPANGGQWTYSVLARLPGGSGGSIIDGGLVIDSAGNLYGTAQNGGAYGDGVVFEVTP